MAFVLAFLHRNCKNLRSAKAKRLCLIDSPPFNPTSALSYAEFCPRQKPALNRRIGIQNEFCVLRLIRSNAS